MKPSRALTADALSGVKARSVEGSGPVVLAEVLTSNRMMSVAPFQPELLRRTTEEPTGTAPKSMTTSARSPGARVSDDWG